MGRYDMFQNLFGSQSMFRPETAYFYSPSLHLSAFDPNMYCICTVLALVTSTREAFIALIGLVARVKLGFASIIR